jgi:hypothetical protein
VRHVPSLDREGMVCDVRRIRKAGAVMNIIEFTDDVLRLSLSPAQRTLLKAFYGLPLELIEETIFLECVERPYEAGREYSELTAICGARSGKDSRLATSIVLYEIFNRDHSSYLHPGEKGVALVVAQDFRGGSIAFNYLKAAIEGADSLASQVVETRKTEIEFDNDLMLSVYPCTYRAARGTTIVVAVADELAFWRSEDGAANPDREILRSIARGTASVPNAKLLKLSTPFSKSGVLHDDYLKRQDLTDTLVWKAPTWMMNPNISQRFLDRERQKDPVAFEREYGANFSDDIAGFVQREAVTACVVPGRFELPYDRRFQYTAFADPSGGSQDSFGMAIGHIHRRDGGNSNRFVLDLIREAKPPFSPEAITAEFSQLLKKYSIKTVTGDAYAGLWPRESFQRHGITYKVSDLNRSELYLELLPLLHSNVVELLDIPRLVSQICGLQRKTAAAGKDRIDHANGQHDDVSNVVAGCLVMAALEPVGNRWGGIF